MEPHARHERASSTSCAGLFEARGPSGRRPTAAMSRWQQQGGLWTRADGNHGLVEKDHSRSGGDDSRSGGGWQQWGGEWWQEDGRGGWDGSGSGGADDSRSGGADGSRSGGAVASEWQQWHGEWWQCDGRGGWKRHEDGSGKWPWSGADGSRSGGVVSDPPLGQQAGSSSIGAATGAPQAGPGPAPVGPQGPALVGPQAEPGPADWLDEHVAAGKVFDAAFFQNFKEFTGYYKQHNVALKWFRGVQENLATPCDLLFSNTSCAAVAAIIKGKGMAYDFDESSMTNWHWFEMVAQLDNQSIADVVNGPDNRSGGLKECWLSLRPGPYDHKRLVPLKMEGRRQEHEQLRVWDFLLVREDDSAIRLHPQWSRTIVDALAGKGHEVTQIPSTGLGGSEGPRTYFYYKELDVKKKLRFDPGEVLRQKGKQKGEQKGK